jgi:transcriptional accessory protein Tex/SPT6
MREGVRETSKDLDASLRSARDKFTLRSEIGDVLSELNIQSEVLGSVHNIVNRTPGLSIGLDEEQALIRVDLLKRDFVGNKETYLIASDLLHSLPNKPSGHSR